MGRAESCSREKERRRRQELTESPRLAVREALDEEAEEFARDGRLTAFSGGALERFRGGPGLA